ncbi:MAG: hypothetical protein A2498_07070 [Lentisphaerae bacterium RIFOXYC12_FULL_60_16]|nr:MAG: hypothetical protein A2498_07070 [Lentisphaerae bacterium RIFOXYC12_FULL_60_16]OGV72501.1 MAG: hypothetical protein A2269_01310 [Lentisphaerae bacterium RIFOXYA12_FULL_60_10]OGV78924.1 MAG: hypothetical protein A2340_03245 [Lentisphaerae bacterium RIFOXYB12_FULL_60_10]
MGAYLIEFKDGHPDLTFPVPESGCVIGRDAGCMIQLTDSLVSRRHALIVCEEGRWFVEDLDTRNGTRVNGSKKTKCAIQHGDRLGFGSKELFFMISSGNQSDFVPSHVIDFSDQSAKNTMVKRSKSE